MNKSLWKTTLSTLLLIISSASDAFAEAPVDILFTFSTGNESFLSFPLPNIQVNFHAPNNTYVGISVGLGTNVGNSEGVWGHAAGIIGWHPDSWFLETSLAYSFWSSDYGNIRRLSLNPKVGVESGWLYAKLGPSFDVSEWSRSEALEKMYWYARKLDENRIPNPNIEIGYALF